MELLSLLLISGPIRRHLWKAHLAFVFLIILLPVLVEAWRRLPTEPTRGTGYFPLTGNWARPLVGVLLVCCVLMLLALFITPLSFFVLFPGLAR